jgi:hypothetical protein
MPLPGHDRRDHSAEMTTAIDSNGHNVDDVPANEREQVRESARDRKQRQRRREYLRSGQHIVAKAMPYLQARVNDPEVPDDRLAPLEVAVRRWKADLIADLGGKANVSTAMEITIEQAADAWITWSSLSAYKNTLAGVGGIVNRRHRRAYGIVQDCERASIALNKLLTTIGLERRAKRVPTLQEYVATRYSGVSKGASPPIGDPTP